MKKHTKNHIHIYSYDNLNRENLTVSQDEDNKSIWQTLDIISVPYTPIETNEKIINARYDKIARIRNDYSVYNTIQDDHKKKEWIKAHSELLEAPYYYTDFFRNIPDNIAKHDLNSLKLQLNYCMVKTDNFSGQLTDQIIKALYFLSLQDGWYSILPSVANKLVIYEQETLPPQKMLKVLSYKFNYSSYEDTSINLHPKCIIKDLTTVQKKFVKQWKYKANRVFNDVKQDIIHDEVHIPEQFLEPKYLCIHKRLSQSIIDTFQNTTPDTKLTPKSFKKRLTTIKTNLDEEIYNTQEIICCRAIFQKTYYELKKQLVKINNIKITETKDRIHKFRKEIETKLEECNIKETIIADIDFAYKDARKLGNYEDLIDGIKNEYFHLVLNKLLLSSEQYRKLEQNLKALKESSQLITNQNLNQLLEDSWIFRFYFELIKLLAVNAGSTNFFDLFREKTISKFNSKKITNIEKEMLIVKQFYASTLGIFGLTRRELSLFKTSKFILNLKTNNNDDNKKYLNLIDWFDLMALYGPSAYFDADMKNETIVPFFKLLACRNLVRAHIFNSQPELHLSSEELKAFNSIKLKRLNSYNNNRGNDNLNITTFFNKVKSTTDTKQLKKQAIILGNIIEDIASIGKASDIAHISPITQLASLDRKIAECFCLLNWDSDEILDTLVDTHIKYYQSKK